MKTVTVLGGSGVFGGRIAQALAAEPGVVVRVAGRRARAGAEFAQRIGGVFRQCDVGEERSLREALEGSDLVIHTAGPFQGRDYRVAEECVRLGAHYLDLADARGFVTGIRVLDGAARRRRVFVCSGASSVPAITDAMIRELWPDFARVRRIEIALSPGNQNPRGASTIAAILSYTGRPIRTWLRGAWRRRPGWGEPRRLTFPPPVGRRRLHNCDVPDLELFPVRWPARTVRFAAGVELDGINYLLSALARLRAIWPMPDLPRAAPILLRLSLLLFRFGSRNGALAVWLRGTARDGAPIERRMAIVTDDDGPATPSSPAIVLARRIIAYGPPEHGAFSCVGFLTLDELMAQLRPLGIWCVRGDAHGWWAP